MGKKEILDELKICSSILSKFKDELEDCKKDYETLKRLEPVDGNNPEFKKALVAVKQRHDDITLSVKLIKNREKNLKEQLESEK